MPERRERMNYQAFQKAWQQKVTEKLYQKKQKE